MAKKSDRLATRLVQAAFFVVLLGAWSIESALHLINPILFPRIGDVAKNFLIVITSPATLTDIWTTMSTFGAAYLIAIILGITVGYVVSTSRLFTKTYEPMLAAFYTVPLLIFFPTFILFFGTGVKSKMALGCLAAFFPIALNTIAGFNGVDLNLRTAAMSFGASRLQMLRRVLLPGAFPIILTGLRVAFIPCFASVLAGEIIASDSGLGHQISQNAQMMETARMFAYVILVIIIAAGFNLLLSTWESRRGRAIA
jgi:ABC-type nitrate/sulfonate/bicarbonate transport system permease component